MSLYRRLLMLLALLLALVFSINAFNSLQSHREYLRLQLNSHAEDAATALGLLLKPYLLADDQAAMTSVVDMMFDRGYYQQILVTDMQGAPILKREVPLQIKDTPAWFVRYLPLQNQAASAEITVGWDLAAQIQVTSHPGFVYAIFWQNTQRECLWALFGWLVAMLTLSVVLRLALAPLRAVEQQAYQICQQQFVTLPVRSNIREFAGIARAMNQLSRTVEQTLSRVNQYASHMREQAYFDEASGLYNATRFRAILAQRLLTGALTQGALLGIRLMGYTPFTWTQSQRDALAKRVADLLLQQAEAVPEAVCSRRAPDEYELLLANVPTLEARLLTQRLLQALHSEDLHGLQPSLALVHWQEALDLNQLDQALADTWQKALKQGKPWCEWFATLAPSAPAEAVDLASLLHSSSIQLMQQQVCQLDGHTPLYQEVLSQVQTAQGERLSLNVWVNHTHQQGGMVALDRQVLQKVLAFLAKPEHATQHLAVNISLDSLQDPDFWVWVLGSLVKRRTIAERLVFELSMHDVTQHYAKAKELMAKAKLLGSRVALEHFGIGFDALSYLSDLKPDLIKIDGSFIRGIATDRDNQFFVHSLTAMAHSLQIQVIAECTESAQDFAMLQTLKVDAAQGFYLAKPVPMGL